MSGYGDKSVRTFDTADDLFVSFDCKRDTYEASVAALSKVLFKNTDCGMFAEEPSETDRAEGVALVVGSIVEGSDAVFVERLHFPLSVDEWNAALQRIEDEAEETWEMLQQGLDPATGQCLHDDEE